VGSSGVSDWDSGSAYSGSSGPNSGYNSPMTTTFSIPTNNSISRPSSRDGPIRLPNAPLTDIATRLTKVPPPNKASSAPYYIEGRSTTLGRPLPPSADYYSRRGSLPTDAISPSGRLTSTLGMPKSQGGKSFRRRTCPHHRNRPGSLGKSLQHDQLSLFSLHFERCLSQKSGLCTLLPVCCCIAGISSANLSMIAP